MGPAEVRFIRETFGLSQRDLAKALNVAPFTVSRWEAEQGNAPTGLQDEVLRGLHNVALQVHAQNDAARAKVIGGIIALGIGALIFYLLSQQAPGSRAS
jgi:transcriptional regulator with XRE-family HTH domain